MIKLNGDIITPKYFPDGTICLNPEIFIGFYKIPEARVTWNFENNEEMVILMFLSRYLQSHQIPLVKLIMPYIPNARQDRVKNSGDVFTLKYFAEFINSLGFDSVEVFDPHSSVSEALIENIQITSAGFYIDQALKRIKDNSQNEMFVFFPDEGARKRYSNYISMPYGFGIKLRNWKTGEIEGFDIAGNKSLMNGKDVLLIDDICSKGDTLYHSIKTLRKEMDIKDVYIYVSHCESTIFGRNLLKDVSLGIKKIFTTDSIFNDNIDTIKFHKPYYKDLFEVLPYF